MTETNFVTETENFVTEIDAVLSSAHIMGFHLERK